MNNFGIRKKGQQSIQEPYIDRSMINPKGRSGFAIGLTVCANDGFNQCRVIGNGAFNVGQSWLKGDIPKLESPMMLNALCGNPEIYFLPGSERAKNINYKLRFRDGKAFTVAPKQ
jgi:hypothetical protein